MDLPKRNQFGFMNRYQKREYLKQTRKFYKQLLKKKYLSVNIDLDGMLSACLLLHVFPHLKIVSFNDGKNNIWTLDGYKKEDMVFVDYNTVCGLSLDQHVDTITDSVVTTQMHNPNHLLGISNKNYGEKYPFGICHNICSDLEKLGADFSHISLDRKIMDVATLGEISMRADSALNGFTDKKYRRKGVEYKNIMCDGLKDDSLTKRFFSKMGMMTMGENSINDTESWERWRIEFNKKVKTTFGLQTRTGYKNITDNFFKLFKELHEAFNIPFDVDTDATHYNNEKLCRIAYHIENNELLENICSDSRVFGKVVLKKNLLSVQIKPADIKDFVEDHWEYIEKHKFNGYKQFTENGKNVYVRKSNEDGTGHLEKKIGWGSKSVWKNW